MVVFTPQSLLPPVSAPRIHLSSTGNYVLDIDYHVVCFTVNLPSGRGCDIVLMGGDLADKCLDTKYSGVWLNELFL